MPSVKRIRASDGTANASQVTVTALRAPGATSLTVDTVAGIYAGAEGFYASMGTPHTFTDPITSETITVISEATAVDFRGHIDTGHIIIDAIAPGYADTNGSKVGDIVVIRPTTQWGDNISDVLAVSLNDDGTLKAVTQNPGWTALAYTPNTVTALGNHSYSCVFNGVDLTSALSNGMRLRTTRTVAAPTQCTSLNGSTQYYSKTSPAGMTGTDGYTWMAWIKPSAYQAGTIIGKYNGTSGWSFAVAATGQVSINGVNAGAVDSGLSYQSVPLNKWIHVAATLSMSTSTANIYIDGVLVPSAYTNGAATAWANAGNLEIGSQNGGTSPFAGKIAQAAIFNAVLSQATIQSYMSQGLAGTETSLISAYSFNNSINDLNANANNLAANGSAVATNVDSPFTQDDTGTPGGSNDYGILMSKTFSGGNTTLVVQTPEGCAIPTSGGVSAVAYSTQKAPFGMPTQKRRWQLITYTTTVYTQNSPGTATWYNLGGFQLSLPIGEWAVNYAVPLVVTAGAATNLSAVTTLATTAAANTDTYWSAITLIQTGVALEAVLTMGGPISNSAGTIYYLNVSTLNAGMSTLSINANNPNARIVAENAYI